MIRPELLTQWLHTANTSVLSSGHALYEHDSITESEFAALLEQAVGATDSSPASNGSPIQMRVIPAKLALEALARQVPIPSYAAVKPASDYATEVTSMKGIEASQRAQHFQPTVEAAAARYHVSSRLIDAVIQVESAYHPFAVSHAGAKGLMQLMDSTARQVGVTNVFDPVQNINGGTKYLADLIRKYKGNEAVALAAYNAGPGRVDRLGITNDAQLFARMDELPAETQGYVRKVLGILNR